MMNDILFEILKAVLILAVILLMRYAVPWMKQMVEDTKYAWVAKWVAVAAVPQSRRSLGTSAEKRGKQSLHSLSESSL